MLCDLDGPLLAALNMSLPSTVQAGSKMNTASYVKVGLSFCYNLPAIMGRNLAKKEESLG